MRRRFSRGHSVHRAGPGRAWERQTCIGASPRTGSQSPGCHSGSRAASELSRPSALPARPAPRRATTQGQLTRLPGSRDHRDGSRGPFSLEPRSWGPPWTLCPTPPHGSSLSLSSSAASTHFFHGRHHLPFQRLASTPPPVRTLHPSQTPAPPGSRVPVPLPIQEPSSFHEVWARSQKPSAGALHKARPPGPGHSWATFPPPSETRPRRPWNSRRRPPPRPPQGSAGHVARGPRPSALRRGAALGPRPLSPHAGRTCAPVPDGAEPLTRPGPPAPGPLRPAWRVRPLPRGRRYSHACQRCGD